MNKNRTPTKLVGAYTTLFSHSRMVKDLLSGFVARDWCDDLDLCTLERLPPNYMGRTLRPRRCDLFWRVRYREKWLYLILILEPRTGPGPPCVCLSTQARMRAYTGLLYQSLIRRGALKADTELPPVLPIVLPVPLSDVLGRHALPQAQDVTRLCP